MTLHCWNDPTKILVYGAADGRPITNVAGVTGVAAAHTTTGTGPYHVDNVKNWSLGAVPVATNVVVFDGLTTNDGPKYALTTLSAVTLGGVKVLPTYKGSIGLPDTSPAGYTEWREKYMSMKSATFSILSNTADADQRFRINGSALAAAIFASGGGGQSGVYPLHLHNFPSTSTLELTNYGAKICPEFGQAATFATIEANNGSALDLESGVVTAGAVTVDGSAAFLDCVYASLTMRGNSNVLGGPNASCSTGTGIAVSIDGGNLDWRSTSKPAAEVAIGTDASLITKRAVGTIATFIAHQYQNSTLDDETGRCTMPQVVNYVRCSPQTCRTIRPEHIKSTWDVLP
jgi:hypothetical protein